MVYRLILSVSLVLSLLLPTASYAQEDKQLNIVTGEWPPYITQKAKNYGPVAHLIRDIFQEIGYRVKFHFAPWGRVYSLAANSRLYDATAVWLYKPTREHDFLYSNPILKESFVFFFLKSKHFIFSQLSDIQGLRLGGNIGHSYGPELDEMISQGKVSQELVANPIQNFGKLLKGRIDLYPQEINVGLSRIHNHLDKQQASLIDHSPTPFLTTHSFVLFPKNMPKAAFLQQHFNEQLAKFMSSGRYRQYVVQPENVPAAHSK